MCFIPLAALADADLLEQEIVRALGLRETQGILLRDQLLVFLATRRVLLVLDNCEHLIGACAQLAETLLQACPELRIVATSREPLRIGGEITWLVPALSLPDQSQLPMRAELPQYEALHLFLDRATAALAQFTLADDEIPALVQICARLDGLPLAVELAAACVPTLSLHQIAARLDDRFRLLRSGNRTALTRQQTLRASIDWSYELLSSAEQQLLCRLSVFAGGWTLEAAEVVCGDESLAEDDVLPLLARLVETSLVVVQNAGDERRYDMLESIRQYALEHLEATGETAALRTRHQRWCLALAARGESELTGSRQVEWLARLAAELDNLRAALQWPGTAPADARVWLQLAYRLYWFWYLHSAVGEGRAAFERALAQTTASDTSWAHGVALLGSGSMALYQGELPLARARLDASLPILRALDDPFSQALAPFMAGTVAVNQGDYGAAQQLLEECLPRFEALGHRQGVATALLHLGDVALGHDEPDQAEEHYRRCLAIHRTETSSTWGIAQALNNLGEVARYRGDLAVARTRYHEALALFQTLATRADVARTQHNLAALALAEGDVTAATQGFRESLALFRAWGNCRGLVECIAGLAQVQRADDGEHAAMLLGFVAGYFAATGATIWPPDRLAFERASTALAARMAPEQLAASWRAGQILKLEQALAAALHVDAPLPTAK